MNFLKDKKAVIFDLDGLLIDSEPAWYQATTALLKKHGHAHSPELHEKVLGMGQKESIGLFKSLLGIKGDTKELIDERRAYFYADFLKKPVFMAFAGEIVLAASDTGMKLAIATGGHPVEKVQEILKAKGLDTYFPLIVSSDSVKEGKPAPDIYLHTAEKLDVDPEECIVIEDAPNGVTAGKAAGMFVIGVNSDYLLQKKLEEAGADIIAPMLEAILPLFRQGCCRGYENCACA